MAESRVTSGDFQIKLELQDDRGKLKSHSTQRARSGVAGFEDLKVHEAGEYSFKFLEGDDYHGGNHHHWED